MHTHTHSERDRKAKKRKTNGITKEIPNDLRKRDKDKVKMTAQITHNIRAHHICMRYGSKWIFIQTVCDYNVCFAHRNLFAYSICVHGAGNLFGLLHSSYRTRMPCSPNLFACSVCACVCASLIIMYKSEGLVSHHAYVFRVHTHSLSLSHRSVFTVFD